MFKMKVKAYAKLNLTLDITGEEGGYHLLDSLVVTVDLYDTISVKKRNDGLVNVVMHGMGSEQIPPERNNAVRAGEAFVSRFHTTGADITIYKNIPVGAGLGGSSVDAAGVLQALAKLYHITDMGALKSLADELGSDTGYLLTGGLARLRGRGEIVEPLSITPQMHFLLLCPRSGVSTAECYARCQIKAGVTRTQRAADELKRGNLEWAARLFGNDLYEPAKALNEEVGRTYIEAKSFSPLGAGMTGSGSAVFALFPTRELCEWAKSRYDGKARAYLVKSVYPKQKRSLRNPFALSDEERG